MKLCEIKLINLSGAQGNVCRADEAYYVAKFMTTLPFSTIAWAKFVWKRTSVFEYFGLSCRINLCIGELICVYTKYAAQIRDNTLNISFLSLSIHLI